MKYIKVLYLLFMVSFLFISCHKKEAKSSDFPQVKALIERQLPQHHLAFELRRVVPKSTDTYGEYLLENGPDQQIIISATDPISAAQAFYHYVKYVMHGHIGRLGRQIPLYERLPSVAKPIFKSTKMPHRYYLNYVTYNYTMSFWDWKDWQQELDWMAMQGINLVLTINGTEAVWKNTLEQVGFSEKEIADFIPGPAYTSWWLMDNLEGWGGPINQPAINQQVALQQKILKQLRDFEMEPILPAFYGMVPNAMMEHFPNNQFHRDGKWGGLQRPAFLMPNDTLFHQLADIFYKEQEKLYGKASFYGGDPFHEGGKKVANLAQAAQGIQAAMLNHQPSASWFLQSWQESPTDALIEGTKSENTLILDLFGEMDPAYCQREIFKTTPFMWGNVNNFGNNTYQYAQLDSIATVPQRLRKSDDFETFRGIGLAMEGSYNDPMPYELFYESAWEGKAINVKQWLKDYANARYGSASDKLETAWMLMYESVYSSTERFENIMCSRPSLETTRATAWGPEAPQKYDQQKLKLAIQQFLTAAEQEDFPATFDIDFAMIFRQYLSAEAFALLQQIKQAYQNGNLKKAKVKAEKFLDLFEVMDKTVASIPHHSLQEWEQKARQRGKEVGLEELYLWNARQLITLWSNQEGAEYLHDYAYKEWNGLLTSFYKKRWQIYFDALWKSEASANEIDFYAWEKQWVESSPLAKAPSKETAISKIVSAYFERELSTVQ
ncbi:alpha-N-acetylglucosaminidase [Persicobacter diffluens]|uniref:Alpha-N-acetylglucosaminidase n=1 Tax=Persicobacter diffluens TaxID=981 RepID=A0AAN4W4A4_9BACT|nr:alpha-N-acetylglucosaminidase [Persicobacter diffluens]